jgi:hypothetical protein
MDAFDADVLIYAAVPVHRLGRRVRALFPVHATTGGARAGIGSVLLLPELLTKPMRDGVETELEAFTAQLGRIDLRPVDPTIAELATALGATHRLVHHEQLHGLHEDHLRGRPPTSSANPDHAGSPAGCAGGRAAFRMAEKRDSDREITWCGEHLAPPRHRTALGASATSETSLNRRLRTPRRIIEPTSARAVRVSLTDTDRRLGATL